MATEINTPSLPSLPVLEPINWRPRPFAVDPTRITAEMHDACGRIACARRNGDLDELWDAAMALAIECRTAVKARHL